VPVCVIFVLDFAQDIKAASYLFLLVSHSIIYKLINKKYIAFGLCI
jgi:hypothetical protein